jgi:nucleoside-diphosphate-sugar epimerase
VLRLDETAAGGLDSRVVTSIQTNSENRDILVIGGRGFVGSAVAREASARGYRVTTIGRDDVESIRGRSFSLVVDANGNSRKYLAARDPALDFDLSVRSVMLSLSSIQADTYLYLSSSEVYENRSDPSANTEELAGRAGTDSAYGYHKLLAESVVRNYASNWLILRLSGFVGEGLWKNPIYDILTGQPIRVSPASQYQFMNTSDLGSIALTLWEQGRNCEVYNVATRGTIALKEVIDLVPEYRKIHFDQDLPVERYELNTQKISAIFPMPETRATVTGFVKDVQSAQVLIRQGVG